MSADTEAEKVRWLRCQAAPEGVGNEREKRVPYIEPRRREHLEEELRLSLRSKGGTSRHGEGGGGGRDVVMARGVAREADRNHEITRGRRP